MYDQFIEFIHSEIEAFVILAAAVTAILSGWSFFFRRNKLTSNSLQSPPVAVKKEEEVQSKTHNHSFELSKRFQHALACLREKHSRMEISEVAKLCHYNDSSVIENIVNATSTTSFSDLETISQHLGVNSEWLTHGYGEAFHLPNLSVYEPTELLDILKERKPLALFFVRSSSEFGEVCFVLKIDDFRYETYTTTIHLSKEVGGTGQRHLYKLYILIKKIKDERVLTDCRGRTLSTHDFSTLISGQAYPGAIVDNHNYQDYWWDDLTDIDHIHLPSNTEYIEHGQQFVDAQSIIRSARNNYKADHGTVSFGRN